MWHKPNTVPTNTILTVWVKESSFSSAMTGHLVKIEGKDIQVGPLKPRLRENVNFQQDNELKAKHKVKAIRGG